MIALRGLGECTRTDPSGCPGYVSAGGGAYEPGGSLDPKRFVAGAGDNLACILAPETCKGAPSGGTTGNGTSAPGAPSTSTWVWAGAAVAAVGLAAFVLLSRKRRRG